MVPEHLVAALQHQHHVDVGTPREGASLSFSLVQAPGPPGSVLTSWFQMSRGGPQHPAWWGDVGRTGLWGHGPSGCLPGAKSCGRGPCSSSDRSSGSCPGHDLPGLGQVTVGLGSVPGCPGLRKTQLQGACQEPTLRGSQRFWGDGLGGTSSPGPPQGRGGSRGRTRKKARGALLDPSPHSHPL